jgi:hypothetical protein
MDVRHAAPLRLRPATTTAVAGQVIEVTIDHTPDAPTELVSGELELVRSAVVTRRRRNWTGTGYSVGLRSSDVITRADLDVTGSLSARTPVTRTVPLFVPATAATITAHLVQQDHLLRARLRTREGLAAEATLRIRVDGRAPGMYRTIEVPPVVDGADFAGLAVEEFSGPRLRAGAPLSGVLTVSPRRAGAVRSVRVDLVLAEHVRARPGEPLEEDCDATTVITSVRVADELHLDPATPLRLPFVLPVPEQLPAPSVSTPEFDLRWLLHAVLDRPLGRELLAAPSGPWTG